MRNPNFPELGLYDDAELFFAEIFICFQTKYNLDQAYLTINTHYRSNAVSLCIVILFKLFT